MHVAVRKNELDRIEKENAIIAKKLYYAEPKATKTKEMRHHFIEHRNLSSNLSKI